MLTRDESPISVEEKGRRLVVHQVLESELRDLVSSQNLFNFNFALLNTMVGVAGGYALASLTSYPVVSSIVILFLVVYFGVKSWLARNQSRRRLEELLRGSAAGDDRVSHTPDRA